MTTKPVRVAALLILAAGAWSLMPSSARAQTLQEQQLEQQGLAGPPTTGKWSVTLGAGVAALPDYPGASAYRARPVPLVSIIYDKLLFLGPFGIGINAINWNGFRAGPVLGFVGGRRQSDDARLNGLGDISPSLTGGIFAAYRIAPFELSGTVRQAITHTGNGLIGLVQLDYLAPIMPGRLTLIAGPHLEFANRNYEQTWFGVTPSQSAQSGLPAYAPGAGIKEVGLHASLTYRYSEHVLLRGFGAIRELTGDAADSPIVQSKTEGLVGLGAAYHF